MQRPPDHPENEQPEPNPDDVENKVFGPSQRDIDRSWDGYESGQTSQRMGGLVWKVTIAIVSLVILASFSIGIVGPLLGGSGSSSSAATERVAAEVLRVIDGRTIVVDWGEGEQTVRLIGVESPPFGNPFHDFAQEVTQSWIGGKEVLLEADQQQLDEQGRLMRYVFFDQVMINAALILNGLGSSETERPNTRYDAYLNDMERQARDSEVGIWDPTFGGDVDSEPADDPQTSIRPSNAAGALAS
jgi:micrococcal nuclease